MSYSSVRSAIKTALEAISGIAAGAGKVTDHEPNVIEPARYVELFANAAGTIINGWTITRTRIVERTQDPGFRFQAIHDFLVRGRYGHLESSNTENTFQTLIENVRSAIRGSVAIWVEHPEESENAIQAEIIGHEMHGPFLVHLAEIRFSVEEFELISA